MSGGKGMIAEGLLPAWPEVNFHEYGEVEERRLSKIQGITAAFMHRNWLSIPHVTHHDELDITDLEAFRKRISAESLVVKLTPLAFQIKGLVAALEAFPLFNASLDSTGSILSLKKYFNVGVAVDTPAGLLVPVIRDCDKKSITEIAAELMEVSTKAKEKGLTMREMSGGCMTITSLGGVGGVGFTPIINAPEVAILGVTRMKLVPQPLDGDEGAIIWRKMLPVSLSYDHRVINGSDAAKFTCYLSELFSRLDYWEGQV